MSSARSPPPSSGSASQSFFRHRNGSGFLSSSPSTNDSQSSGLLGRFRRPRTATSNSRDNATPTSTTDYGAMSSDDVTTRTSGHPPRGSRHFLNPLASNVPRSTSSSHVYHFSADNTNPPLSSPQQGSSSPGSRISSHNPSRSQSNIRSPLAESEPQDTSSVGFPSLARSGSAQGSGIVSGGGIGRMLRRYSQGPGRTLSNAQEQRATTSHSPRDTPSPHHEANQSELLASTHSPSTVLSTTQTGAITNAAEQDVSGGQESNEPPKHRIRLVPNLEATRSLHFEPIERDVFEGVSSVKIGRFTDRGQQSSATTDSAGNTGSSGIPGARGGAIPSSSGGSGRVDTSRIAFKSKVVSRGHAEIWCESGGKFFIRDTKSSSGTFLNHIRLSNPNSESRPHQIRDGDVVQLGVDYQGGTEEIYRCVKMRVELNRAWQRGANEYNINALRQLEALRGNSQPKPATAAPSNLPTNREALSVTDCCICLYSVSVCQALFIAPCSHVYHYKCIRPLINRHFPGFQCPLCRTFADLDADVERDDAWQEELLRAELVSRQDASRAALDAVTPSDDTPLPSLTAAAALHESSTSYALDTSAESHHTHDVTAVMPSEGLQDHSRTVSSQDRSLLDRAPEQGASPRHTSQSSRPGTGVSSSTVVPNGHVSPSSRTQAPPRTLFSRNDEGQEILQDASSSRGPHYGLPPLPIDIQARNAAAMGRQAFSDDIVPSPGFNDSRTPQNEHFLSTLAEAPPPPPSSLRAMEHHSPHLANRSVHSDRAGSLGEVFSTPIQGNSPTAHTSTLEAVLAASHLDDALASPAQRLSISGSGEGSGHTQASDAQGPALGDASGKGKAPQNATMGPSQRQARLNGTEQPSTSIHRRGSIRSTHSESGTSSRETHNSTAPVSSGKMARIFRKASNVVN